MVGLLNRRREDKENKPISASNQVNSCLDRPHPLWYTVGTEREREERMVTTPENIEYQIRDKLAEDPRICDLIKDDDDFDHLMDLIGNAIDDWLNPIQLFLDKRLK